MSTAADVKLALQAQGVLVAAVVAKYKPAPPPPGPGPWVVQAPLSVNSGPCLMGQNFHNWGDPANVASQMIKQGCKLARYGAGAPADATVDLMLDSFFAASLPVLYNLKRQVSPSDAAALARTAGHVVPYYEYLNEATGSITPADYYSQLKAISAAVKAVAPYAQICGPTGWGTEGGLGGNWNQTFLGMNPWSFLDCFSYHAYYGTPEANFSGRVMTVARMVEASARAAGKQPKIIASEQGWTTGNRSDDIKQPQANIEAFYTRSPWLLSGSPYMVAVTYYEAKNDGNDPAQGEQMFGMSDTAWNWKPQAAIARDCFAVIHASTARRVYQRGASWFVCCETPAGQFLAAWNPSATAVDKVWCVGSSLKIQTLGANSVTAPVANSQAQMQLTLSPRAVLLSGCRFPEFS